ncbi:hypothetical protein NHX12_005308 [Muraenolepis orangiensis]|uniref:Uncharacterized protein n=1 Tax=Muraenolepis orangiensis TaxID=630683 RepID=A0A9Q0DTQ2_9TELE|nr:hypothetical protein NHX12_005308 [Muraenolepis orangiensis]
MARRGDRERAEGVVLWRLGIPARGLRVKVSADSSSVLLLLLCPEATGGTQTQTLVMALLLFRPPINVTQGTLWPTDAGIIASLSTHMYLLLHHHLQLYILFDGELHGRRG